jgi:hypothetical protein
MRAIKASSALRSRLSHEQPGWGENSARPPALNRTGAADRSLAVPSDGRHGTWDPPAVRAFDVAPDVNFHIQGA